MAKKQSHPATLSSQIFFMCSLSFLKKNSSKKFLSELWHHIHFLVFITLCCNPSQQDLRDAEIELQKALADLAKQDSKNKHPPKQQEVNKNNNEDDNDKLRVETRSIPVAPSQDVKNNDDDNSLTCETCMLHFGSHKDIIKMHLCCTMCINEKQENVVNDLSANLHNSGIDIESQLANKYLSDS